MFFLLLRKAISRLLHVNGPSGGSFEVMVVLYPFSLQNTSLRTWLSLTALQGTFYGEGGLEESQFFL